MNTPIYVRWSETSYAKGGKVHPVTIQNYCGIVTGYVWDGSSVRAVVLDGGTLRSVKIENCQVGDSR